MDCRSIYFQCYPFLDKNRSDKTEERLYDRRTRG